MVFPHLWPLGGRYYNYICCQILKMHKILFALLFFTSNLLAQNTGTIRGFVYDLSSGEPVMFCNVILKGTTIGAATDVNGMYNLSKI